MTGGLAMTRTLVSLSAAAAAAVFAAGCGQYPTGPVAPDPPASEAFRANDSAVASALSAPLDEERHVCVPFTVHGGAGSVEVAGGPPPAPLVITLSAAGHAAHLGHYSSSASFVVTFPSSTAAVFAGGGTFTAANGDEVHFGYSGDFFPGPVAGGLGSYEIAGGTGRFEGATGSGGFRSEGGETTFDGDICFAR
jgi:hypothetical protein